MKRYRVHPVFGFTALALAIGIGGYGLDALADTFSSAGGVPRLVPFRGHLESGGVPVSVPVTARFWIYDAPTGGTLLWVPESHTVSPVAGDFQVMLGETVGLSPSFVEGGDAYVAVEVEGSLLASRQRFGAVAYALRSENGSPTGSVTAYAGAGTAPAGWLLCDGRALSSEEYPELFVAIGTAWGDGSTGAGALAGVTDFNLPDLRGRFLRGVYTTLATEIARDEDRAARIASAPGGLTGAQVGTLQGDALQSHTHPYTYFAHEVTGTAPHIPTGDPDSYDPYAAATGAPSGARVAAETRPENAAVRYIIKV